MKFWSLILKKKYRLIVFINSVLRRIIVPKKNDVRGNWRDEVGRTCSKYGGEDCYIQPFDRDT
jgi:hypothetical protein